MGRHWAAPTARARAPGAELPRHVSRVHVGRRPAERGRHVQARERRRHGGGGMVPRILLARRWGAPGVHRGRRRAADEAQDPVGNARPLGYVRGRGRRPVRPRLLPARTVRHSERLQLERHHLLQLRCSGLPRTVFRELQTVSGRHGLFVPCQLHPRAPAAPGPDCRVLEQVGEEPEQPVDHLHGRGNGGWQVANTCCAHRRWRHRAWRNGASRSRRHQVPASRNGEVHSQEPRAEARPLLHPRGLRDA
mmetsp:Transcript_31286/g.73205  ORF Transcript_31286/g.73205 Transcript_31286/m.73205 type:complete len:249 (-) Transcript_31286:57-803(-)